MPEGSSSEAPVMNPGPRSFRNRLTGLRSRSILATRGMASDSPRAISGFLLDRFLDSDFFDFFTILRQLSHLRARPACEYNPISEGSTSEAPVIKLGRAGREAALEDCSVGPFDFGF